MREQNRPSAGSKGGGSVPKPSTPAVESTGSPIAIPEASKPPAVPSSPGQPIVTPPKIAIPGKPSDILKGGK